MSWTEVSQKIEELSDEMLNLSIIKDYLGNEQNYDVEKQTLSATLFYFVNSIKRELNKFPNSIDDVRNAMLAYNNDLDKISEYINKLLKDIGNINEGFEIVKLLVKLDNETYEFEDGYENSLFHQSYMYQLKKVVEIYERDDMDIREKYEYCDGYSNSLTEEDKGELHIQTLISEHDKQILNKATLSIFMEETKKGDPINRIQKIHDTFLQIGGYAEERLENGSLEEQLEWLDSILKSRFVKKMNDEKKLS